MKYFQIKILILDFNVIEKYNIIKKCYHYQSNYKNLY